MGFGVSLRVVRGLDHRQQRYFGRHLAAFDFFGDVEQVMAAAIHHAREIFGLGGVEDFPVTHQIGIHGLHGVTVAHSFPDIFGRYFDLVDLGFSFYGCCYGRCYRTGLRSDSGDGILCLRLGLRPGSTLVCGHFSRQLRAGCRKYDKADEGAARSDFDHAEDSGGSLTMGGC